MLSRLYLSMGNVGVTHGALMSQMMINGRYVGQWKWQHKSSEASYAKLSKAYQDAVVVVEGVGNHKASLEQSGQLTASGIKAEMRKYLEGDKGKNLAKAKIAISHLKVDIEKRSAAISLHGPDKTDVVGALLRQEIRAYVRNMDIAKRTALLTSDDLAPEIALAVIEAPAELSGASNGVRELLANKALEALHPKEFRDLSELDEAIETAENAIRAAEKEIETHAKVGPLEFNEIMSGMKFVQLFRETERSAATGYVDKEIIKVRDMDRMTIREATPEEIENGYFVDTH